MQRVQNIIHSYPHIHTSSTCKSQPWHATSSDIIHPDALDLARDQAQNFTIQMLGFNLLKISSVRKPTVPKSNKLTIPSIQMRVSIYHPFLWIRPWKWNKLRYHPSINTYCLESATSSKYQNTIHPYMSSSYHQPNHLQKWIHLRISSIHPSSCSTSSPENKQNNHNIAAEFFLHSCNKTKQCTMQHGCRIQ